MEQDQTHGDGTSAYVLSLVRGGLALQDLLRDVTVMLLATGDAPVGLLDPLRHRRLAQRHLGQLGCDRFAGAESTMFGLAFHERDPRRMYCGTNGGQVFASHDGGGLWTEYDLPEGADQLYALACG